LQRRAAEAKLFTQRADVGGTTTSDAIRKKPKCSFRVRVDYCYERGTGGSVVRG
jgi:hypothetical protein